MLVLEHGKPMIFGKDRDKGIRLDGLQPEVVTIGEDGVTEADLLVHDETADRAVPRAHASRMSWPDFPVPVGVLRAVAAADPRPADRGPDRRPPSRAAAGRPREVLNGGETWTVE